MDFVSRTIELAMDNVKNGGRPFACLIEKGGKVVAESANLVEQTNDPTAHAEIEAIRKAAKVLGTEHFTGCTFYMLPHPCPMCLSAMYYASPDKVIFITKREDCSKYYVEDRKYYKFGKMYEEVMKPWKERKMPMVFEPDERAVEVYKMWKGLNS